MGFLFLKMRFKWPAIFGFKGKQSSMRKFKAGAFLLSLASGCVLPALAGAAQGTGEAIAVAAKASADYVRAKLPNGSFQPETYAFGQGGLWTGDARDYSIDQIKFLDIAKTIAGPLADQNYIPDHDPGTTKLLIMVYWGSTRAPGTASESVVYHNLSDAEQSLQIAKQTGDVGSVARADDQLTTAMISVQMENRRRNKLNAQNASMLGYDSWWESTQGFENTPFNSRRQDMIDELEDQRYFVVLMAYDFQLMWKQKKRKLLWETRFSISGRHSEFDQQLAVMAQDASRFFGRDSHGLVHRSSRDGHVDLGDTKYLGVVPGK
jgi:hypothetical protein